MGRTGLIHIAVLAGVLLFAWPAMMLLHEAGHVFAAWVSGGSVAGVVWHPLVFSRTDVSPNPSPLFVVWAGPVVGCLLAIGAERVVARLSGAFVYMAQLTAGFCLIANGAYIGLGHLDRVGDAGDMVRLGTPVWCMILFGVAAGCLGLWYWHLASDRFRGRPSAAIPVSHALVAIALALVINAVAFVTG